MSAAGLTTPPVSTNDPWGVIHDIGLGIPDDILPIHRDDSAVAAIAPWLLDPTPPTPQQTKRSFGFASMSSTSRLRSANNANLRSRGSSDASQPEVPMPLDSNPHKDGKKSFFNFIKKKASRHAFPRDDGIDRFGTQSISSFGAGSISGSDSKISIQATAFPPSTSGSSFSPQPPSKRFRKASKPKSPGYQDPTLTLDTNLGDMSGIIDPSRVGTRHSPGDAPVRSPWDQPSVIGSGDYTVSSPFPGPSTYVGEAAFANVNPFLGGFTPRHGKGRFNSAASGISPKTTHRPVEPIYTPFPPPLPPVNSNHSGSPTWVAPESWATIPREGGKERDLSSDEEDFGQELKRDRPPSPSTSRSLGAHVSQRRVSPRRMREKSLPAPPPLSPNIDPERRYSPPTSIRIYRTDGQYHVVNCPLRTTVSDMRVALTKRLSIRGDTHRLYLRERGRERALGNREEPAMILRRRLEQAGYVQADDLDAMGGEDLGFLLRFVFRNASLGGVEADDDTFATDFEHIELAERGLETVPIVLHQHASSIITLNLSKNPLVDLPLDFIQNCTSLAELRLSHVSMKRVPHTIREIKSLQWLDISCNRIVELDSAGLNDIPNLRQVFVQNNRISNLPRSFADMKSLKFLNISNNKFDRIPPVVCDIINLVDLDVSFNSISHFPPEMGRLLHLERLIIVGNQITSFPPECRKMVSLRELDCRRNLISDLSPLSDLPGLESLLAEYNQAHVLDLAVGPKLLTLSTSHNPITKFNVRPLSNGIQYPLISLDLSNMKLSTLDDDGAVFSAFTSLVSLKLDYNKFHSIPDVICTLLDLEYLSCTNNDLHTLPTNIGQLQKLRTLNVHNNNIKVIPESIWECGSLVELNISSNLLDTWQDPAVMPSSTQPIAPSFTGTPFPEAEKAIPDSTERKGSAAGLSSSSRSIPPLANSLQRLLLADNHLGYDSRTGFNIFRPLAMMRELRVLNLSFNKIGELPPLHLQTFAQLQELYLSGNNLTSLAGEEMQKLSKLKVLHLNGNKLQTLPAELRRVGALETLDVGNNQLKYNIANWQYDWNWNFNSELKYLNLSGNKRLEIKNHQMQGMGMGIGAFHVAPPLFDFANLNKLRVLGLMDVTLVVPSVPDDNLDRRVRTSDTEINGMAYGIADTLGKVDGPSTFDLVLRNFRGKDNESLFCMFGRAVPNATTNRAAKYLHENFSRSLTDALAKSLERSGSVATEDVPDSMRSAFLSLNRGLYEHLATKRSDSPGPGRKLSTISAAGPVDQDLKSGASAVVVYIKDHPQVKTMYVANVGNMLAVVSRSNGASTPVSVKHDPFDRSETIRIRAAEGWVSPKGMVNDEEDLSRSFGLFHLLPAVNARPDVRSYRLSEEDELVIIGNRGLWDFVSLRTAVDIARVNRHDPMKAAQMLRDFAMSYGADGNTVIMVIAVADLFGNSPRSRAPAADADPFTYLPARRVAPRMERERLLTLLDEEIPPPVGYLALVFTDIRNSTSLWEKNAGMALAMKVHNELLRRQLRLIGGYEVKTEGDSFMVSFHTVSAALLWCFMVQTELLKGDWPIEILESEEGEEILDQRGRIVARGLSVRMGIHWGKPVCVEDALTARMDYFGPMVNRAARIMSQAQGGQIMISSDVVKEINRMAEGSEGAEGPQSHVDALKKMGIEIVEVGERSLKGLEVPEFLSLVFPSELIGRTEPRNVPSPAAGSRVHPSVEQIKQLALVTIRLEALASGRVFRGTQRKSLQSTTSDALLTQSLESSLIMYADAELLIPNIRPDSSEQDLLLILDTFSCRIENALSTLRLKEMENILAKFDGTTPSDPNILLQAIAAIKSGSVILPN